jgi:superfamily II RNA helicase
VVDSQGADQGRHRARRQRRAAEAGTAPRPRALPSVVVPPAHVVDPQRLVVIRAAADYREFARLYPFTFDDFQVEAIGALLDGRSVLVAAPTGSGKTVVGEFACWQALRAGATCFYTTPVKALSNQKYADLCARHGAANVGLLTGDISVNADAPIVVMTTEVLRNMIYAGSSARAGLGWGVMDEVHYLADRFRGAVWEEVILGLSDGVRMACLSATVSNAEQFGAWLTSVRPGGVDVVVSEDRPVPLYQHIMVGRELLGLYDRSGENVNPQLMRYALQQAQQLKARGPRGYGRGGGGKLGGDAGQKLRSLTPSRAGIVSALQRADLLPAIVFIFSRNGCDGAVKQLVRAGVRLTDRAERAALREIADRHGASLGAADREAIGWDAFVAALGDGIAAHHAGLLPVCKAIVEEGFVRGLLKVVFATETLALGINMPARTVVIEKLVKYNGEATVELTPGEYTQLTGRAGRRGLDVEGHAVVAWNSTMNPKMVAGLASRRTFPLRSSFAPTYNMAVNLIASIGRAKAATLLRHSYAQFQADQEPRRAGRSLTVQFEAVCAVLEELGYLAPGGNQVASPGRTLRKVYCELGLVVVQAMRAGVFDRCSVPVLAALLSCVVYESRRDKGGDARVRDPGFQAGFTALEHVARDIAQVERRARVEPGPGLDAGFAGAAFSWAQGAPLADVLWRTGLAAGDFVRWIRQVIDLAAQLANAPGVGPLRPACQGVVDALRRDIVDADQQDADD